MINLSVAQEAQNELLPVRSLVYMTDLSVIITQIPTSLILLYLAMLAKRVHKSGGITLWFLIVLSTGMCFFSFGTVFQFSYSIKLMDASDSQQLLISYQKYYRCQIAMVVIAILSQSGYNVAHWVFAYKPRAQNRKTALR